MAGTGERGERGAIAVLVSVVLLLVGFPLVGLGYASYVRGATAAELTRAADSGALAGASAIPLADLTFVKNYLSNVSGLAIPLPAGSPDPLAIACAQARSAAQADDGFSRSYAKPPPDGASEPACTATYLPDDGFVGSLTTCLDQLRSYVPLPLVGGLYATLVAGLGRTLPALLHPGVRVTLTWNVRSPLGEFAGGDGTAKVQTVTSAARRRFKNLVVLPTLTPPGAGSPIPLNAAVSAVGSQMTTVLQGLDGLLAPTSSLVGLSGCNGMFGSLSSDVSDLVNPPPDAGAPSVEQVLDAAAADGDAVFLLMVPTSLTAALGIPFLDFVPVCSRKNPDGTFHGLANNLGPVGQCIHNMPGAFRATLAAP